MIWKTGVHQPVVVRVELSDDMSFDVDKTLPRLQLALVEAFFLPSDPLFFFVVCTCYFIQCFFLFNVVFEFSP